ncbi:EboA domain-containing protein [Streptomyces sp. NPDC000151]|uniref:EboA domain-containing protein n=1 Tax=Streptomyces sp. NPDC000151 TaxID=3154244 RepID=UPI003316E69D
MTRLDKALRDRLGAGARAWLDEALTEATTHATGGTHGGGATPSAPEADGPRSAEAGTTAPAPARRSPSSAAAPTWETRFAAAGRHCVRREPPHHADPEAAEAARVLILCAARADGATVTRLYEHGTAAERRAVLLALPHLPAPPPRTDGTTSTADSTSTTGTDDPYGLPLIEDALRTNDTRLVAAAVGPYAARHLDAHAWRHAVLKCLFTGVPVDAVAALAERSRGDAELARMLDDYARERTSAGRPVPDDLARVLALTQLSPLSADASADLPNDVAAGSSGRASADPSPEEA